MKNFVTIAVFTFPSEYAVLKLLLEQNELRFVFLNETMISVLPFHSNAFGGIRLQVHKEDKEDALAILQSLDGPSSQLTIV